MTLIAAADGCKDGWIVVEGELMDTPPTVRGVANDLPAALSLCSQPPVVMAIDIPIGLAINGRRSADDAARQFIGHRRSSVFFAPARPVVEYGQAIHGLAHHHRECVSRWAKEHDYDGLGSQAFGIFPKICEIDSHLKSSPDRTVYEVHPEVSWKAMAGDEETLESKHSAHGIIQRIRLIQHHLGEKVLCQPLPAGRYAIDDLLDALAGFWSARRIAQGVAVRLPEPPDIDQVLDREIAIWY